MKTIKTLAGEIGVTKQAIFQKMKKEPLASGLNNLTTRVGGIVYVYPEGEGMIKEQFRKVPHVFSMPQFENSVDGDIIDALRDSISVAQQQLDKKDRQISILNLHISTKDKQIENLHRQIEELGKALTIAQEQAKTAQLLHAGDIHREIISIITESQKDRKEGFWKRAFGGERKKGG
jgi:hypothetical protein